ncbi:MAG: helix-turn-helix domain-containing protein [Actinomycetota bacterium]|nr:helix-turn-helix domain-containing protein [Actinomycetota bacterium]
MTERRTGTNKDGFRTPAEAARILHVPLRRVLEWLAAGEIEAEQDPVSGRWMIPQSFLKGSDPAKQTEEEMAWAYEKERLLAELHEWRARAERERGRAERLQDELEGLRKELEVDRLRQGRGGGTSEA